MRVMLLASVAAVSIVTPAWSNETAKVSGTPVVAATAEEAAAAEQDRDHVDEPRDIIITAPFERNTIDVLSGTSVLTGPALTRDLRPTIGDSLTRLPGVSSTSFGPNASRPVLRGFQGDRIRVLTDGIGSFDASATSVDHAVVINPLTAERIEVLRGPSALLFGSSAIGGVVNVIDNRIPRRMPESPLHVDGIATYGSAANERSLAATTDVPVGNNIVFHLDGSYLRTDDLRSGGYLLTPALRAQAAASADPEIQELADLEGDIPNTASETWNVAAGVSYISDSFSLGVAYSHYDSLYGVPVRFSLDPAIEAEEVRLQLKQDRVDIRAEVDLGDGFFKTAKLRLGGADYIHQELEDTGAVGTTFFNEGYEGRLELVQGRQGGWQGAIGGQFLIRKFNVDGDEKFLPPTDTQQYGLFTLQSFDLGPFKVEAGARYEHSIISADADVDIGNPDLRRTFDAFSGSVGASYALADGFRLGVNLSRTERAPSAEELYANGPHAGTKTFEVGDPTFTKEASWGLEGTLRGSGDGWSVGLSGYYNWFDNYIYDFDTGLIDDDLPVFQFAQGDARIYGIEFEAQGRLATIGKFDVNADVVADFVNATVTGFGPAPRIPPLRVLTGLEAKGDRLTFRAEVEYSAEQDRVTGFETPTDDFAIVNASIAYAPFGKDNPTMLLLSANNIFDATARRHSSFLKDYAPLAGRDIRLTARFRF